MYQEEHPSCRNLSPAILKGPSLITSDLWK